jgi:hypothetical protein
MIVRDMAEEGEIMKHGNEHYERKYSIDGGLRYDDV